MVGNQAAREITVHKVCFDMNTVIVTPDLIGPIRNGGVGTFATNLAFLLQEAGNDVTVLFTGPFEIPPHQWRHNYEARGVKVVPLERPTGKFIVGDSPLMRISELVYEHLPEKADVVYFQDWLANGLHTVRMGQVSPSRRSMYVTTLHGSTQWIYEGMQQYLPAGIDMLNLCYAEQYTIAKSDFVASPSQYMLDWVTNQGWRLPDPSRCAVLGLPYLASPVVSEATPPRPYREIVFFGRLETRKGIDLFINGLSRLIRDRHPALKGIEKIVLVGKPGEHRFGNTADLIKHLENLTQISVEAYTDLNAFEAKEVLLKLAASALVVFPSLSDNFPYAILEASLIPNLNFIYSNVGGIPEVVNRADCLFEPYPAPFAARLAAVLERGHQPPGAGYDWQAANQRWLNFHQQVVHAGSRRIWPKVHVKQPACVDVCVPYFNHGDYLPGLVSLLEQQTWTAFNVYIVNDGSTDPASNRVFDELAEANCRANWHFVRQANAGASAARNYAASLGQSEYVLFIDSDNLPLPTMIERLVVALECAYADCVSCYYAAYESNHVPNALRDTPGSKRPLYMYKPIGNFTEAGLFNNCFGDTNFIIRRSVFETLGGFTTHKPEYRFLGNEDYEFLARLSLAGYSLEIVPEILFFYRHLAESVQRSSNPYSNMQRVQQVYKERLQQIGLGFLSPYVYGLSVQAQTVDRFANIQHDPVWVAYHIPWYILRDAFREKAAKHIRRLLRRVKG